jgi:2-keto-4-pentenoate hydratase/2-oxohepta-3-ene-1,7-dioic acid hydratase in catechol pathway/catechol 2,3-dioxygenase-like lactoylglutathione lyase family enzyme
MTDTTVIHPKFHHVNLKTTRLQEMIDFYRELVGAEVIFQDQVGAWLSNDDANHRIALLAFPNFVDDPDKDNRTGMHHSAFEYTSFDELNSSYLRLKEAGITPALCLDHGMTLSYYYADPDGNNVELQVDNFSSCEKSKEWMSTSDEFKANPIDVFVDPDRVAADYADGLGLPRDPRQGDGRRLCARAGAGRDPGGVVMRLCRFDAGAGPRQGVVEDGCVVDRDDPAERHPLEEVRLLAPVQPRKFLAIGLNYADHIAESGMEAPQFPVFFNKQVTCVVGPDDDVHMPRVSSLLDYEGELAVVIGTRCRHVPADRAHEAILGYTIANDVSVRDWQVRTPTMTMGKSFDTHGPLGPWIVTQNELGDPHQLSIRTWVGDELRQDGNTREMIYDCYEQVAHLSQAFTLEPGDVIATGTPAGIGAVRQPFPEGLLKIGDAVRVEIEGLGELRNTVVEEPEGYLAPEAYVEEAWVR